MQGSGMADGRVVAGDIPQEPPGFRLRAELLAELGRAGSGPGVRVVTGMPGAGKTQLAAAYARARLADGWRLVAWVDACDQLSLLDGMAEVAEAMPAADGARERAGDPDHRVRRRLEADGDRCLVVLDDACDPELLRPLLPRSGAGQVLITSDRPPVAALGVGSGVDALSAEEAVEFLVGRAGLAESAEAGAVAVQLGCLPLALAQAGAVIAAQHLSYDAYLGRLRAVPAREYLAGGQGHPCPRGVAEAVGLALDALGFGEHADTCLGIMEMMAVLSAAGVRRDLLYDAGRAAMLYSRAGRGLRQLLWGTPQAVPAARVDGALAELAGRSLLTLSLDGQTAVAHRLVMQVMRQRLARRGRLAAVCKAAASVLDTRMKTLGGQDRLAVWDIAEQCAALRDAAAQSARAGEPKLPTWMLRVESDAVYRLNSLGDSAWQTIVAAELLTADCTRAVGPNFAGTVASRNILAAACLAAGRTDEAIALSEQNLAATQRG